MPEKIEQKSNLCIFNPMKGLPMYLILCCMISFAQSGKLKAQTTEEERTIIFDAVGVALNHTMLGGHDGLTYQLGFGIGAYHSGRKGKRLDILFGMEYNLHRQMLNFRREGRWGYTEDVQYTIHAIAVPVFVRWHLDGKQRFFVEAGAFMDLFVFANEQEIRHSIGLAEGVPSYSVSSTKSRARISNFNYGLHAGLGCRMRVAGKAIVLKADARYGLPVIHEDMITEMHVSYGRISAIMEF